MLRHVIRRPASGRSVGVACGSVASPCAAGARIASAPMKFVFSAVGTVQDMRELLGRAVITDLGA